MLLMANEKYFPAVRMPEIKQRLTELGPEKASQVLTSGYKDPMIVLILGLVVGGFGVDRFYIGDTTMGVLKLLTCGGMGIWTIIDWFLIMQATKQKNIEELLKLL